MPIHWPSPLVWHRTSFYLAAAWADSAAVGAVVVVVVVVVVFSVAVVLWDEEEALLSVLGE